MTSHLRSFSSSFSQDTDGRKRFYDYAIGFDAKLDGQCQGVIAYHNSNMLPVTGGNTEPLSLFVKLDRGASRPTYAFFTTLEECVRARPTSGDAAASFRAMHTQCQPGVSPGPLSQFNVVTFCHLGSEPSSATAEVPHSATAKSAAADAFKPRALTATEPVLLGAGSQHFVLRDQDGNLTAAGVLPDFYIQLGVPPSGNGQPPRPLELNLAPGVDIQSMTVSETYFTCFLLTNGTVTCATFNDNIKDDKQNGRNYPYIINLPLPATAVSCGSYCVAVLSDGSAWFWHMGEFVFIESNGVSRRRAQSLPPGFPHFPPGFCFLTPTDHLQAPFDASYLLVPAKINLPQGETIVKMCSMILEVCAITSANKLYCSGIGGLGSQTLQSFAVPTTPVDLACSTSTAFALLSDGTVFSYGSGAYGQLGTGSTLPAYQFEQVMANGGASPLTNVAHIFAGGNGVCAVKADETVWCWCVLLFRLFYFYCYRCFAFIIPREPSASSTHSTMRPVTHAGRCLLPPSSSSLFLSLGA